MAYKCRICGSNEVDNPGDVCELCAIGADPYAAGLGVAQAPQYNNSGMPQQTGSGYTPKHTKNRKVLLNGGTAVANTDPYGNDMTAAQTSAPVQVYAAGQLPQQSVVSKPAKKKTASKVGKHPLTTGIVKNLVVDKQERSFISRWFRALFTGTPYLMDDEITMFQIFPDYTGTSLTASGNACDQVIVYGKLNHGAVNENNEVEVYGRRDLSNNIIAKTIKNKASGTVCSPKRTISCLMAWLITLIVVPTAIVLAGSLFFIVIPLLVVYLFIKIKNFLK